MYSQIVNLLVFSRKDFKILSEKRKVMIKFLFYFVGVLFVMYEMSWILNPKKFVLDRFKFDLLTKDNNGKEWGDMSKEYKDMLKKKIFHLILVVWFLCGLFTFNWVAFLFILIFNFAVIGPFSRLLKPVYEIKKIIVENNVVRVNSYLVLMWFNSIVGAFWGVFVIINSYHLKIDLAQLLLAI